MLEYVEHQSTNVSTKMERTRVTAVWSTAFITIPKIGPVSEVRMSNTITHSTVLWYTGVSPCNQSQFEMIYHNYFSPPEVRKSLPI